MHNGIEWQDACFSKDKMIITFQIDDAARAYDILRSEISIKIRIYVYTYGLSRKLAFFMLKKLYI